MSLFLEQKGANFAEAPTFDFRARHVWQAALGLEPDGDPPSGPSGPGGVSRPSLGRGSNCLYMLYRHPWTVNGAQKYLAFAIYINSVPDGFRVQNLLHEEAPRLK